ncbi:Pimeloyl-ACP methyl ester carboxylesterase OS=Streptomyces violarus OX=67380 GN=FHS41_003901 PE=4 SV=1 [Streptomyces violarus]
MSVTRPVRLAGRLVLALAAIAGLVVLFLALIVRTPDGAGSGLPAWLTTLGIATAAALWRGRRRTRSARLMPFLPVVIAAALTASVCVPTVPTERHIRPTCLSSPRSTGAWPPAAGWR